MVSGMNNAGTNYHNTCAVACPGFGYGVYFSNNNTHAFPSASTTTCSSITTDPTSCRYSSLGTGDTIGDADPCDAPNNNYYCCCK
ncbi:unnamed protein product [Adineta steineri]|uniref:Uncharacterized protein n=1 Tax=Adineta steineri TaxID=433720 RepID=A0A814V4I1_9BILA|nr:unnamed protein product [Adineta steineri]CAF0970838.1 unnamed protein product [Adineta steineri]CAF1182942.1 unnamed protein product [Adineta steineri]CAF1211353.1 unnamed protein product [Adineta steineri]CAF1363583.1 unnamed protein product [Adineta steineri]